MHFVPHRTGQFSRRQVALASALPFALAAAITILWIHHRGSKKTPAIPKIVVTSVRAKKGDIGVYLDAIGTVTPINSASIASQVAGMIAAVHYKEGQFVSKGDLLIEINSAPYRANLMQAEGALLRDQNLLAQARMDLKRYEAAWRRRAISRQQFEDQEKLVRQYEGTVQNDLGVVKYAQIQVGYCSITAPFAGRVGLQLVDPGNLVQATGSPVLAVVTETAPITVIFTLPEDVLGEVKDRLSRGEKLAVDAYDRARRAVLASGTLLALDNQIDTLTGTIRARAEFENANGTLFPNQFVNVRLLVETKTGVILLPSSSIQQSGTASFVYVLKDGIARERAVKRGVSEAEATQVEGVAADEWVADTGFDRLRDGAPVAISTSAAAGERETSSRPPT